MRESTRLPAAVKAELLALVVTTRGRTGWTVRAILQRAGLSPARYRAWRRRQRSETLADRTTRRPLVDGILLAERDAVIQYALAHPTDGYRRLTWQMIDADVAYLSASSVYRILDAADLLSRWKRSAAGGEKPAAPWAPHQRWHTDLMYLRVADTWYFLVTVLDAFSRYVVHWELLTSMRAADVRLVVQAAVERTGTQPQVVTDNGAQFTAAEFKDLVRRFALEHIRIRTYHPESNGVVERFHRSTLEALRPSTLQNLSPVRALIASWVEHYNEEWLHASLGYLPPAVYYRGDPAQHQAAWQAKLQRARHERRQARIAQLTRAA